MYIRREMKPQGVVCVKNNNVGFLKFYSCPSLHGMCKLNTDPLKWRSLKIVLVNAPRLNTDI